MALGCDLGLKSAYSLGDAVVLNHVRILDLLGCQIPDGVLEASDPDLSVKSRRSRIPFFFERMSGPFSVPDLQLALLKVQHPLLVHLQTPIGVLQVVFQIVDASFQLFDHVQQGAFCPLQRFHDGLLRLDVDVEDLVLDVLRDGLLRDALLDLRQ